MNKVKTNIVAINDSFNCFNSSNLILTLEFAAPHAKPHRTSDLHRPQHPPNPLFRLYLTSFVIFIMSKKAHERHFVFSL